MTCRRDGWLSANTVRTSVSRPCPAASDTLFGRAEGPTRCAQSLCNWAKASCIPRVCSRARVSAMRARTMPSSPRQPSTATNPSTLMATSSSTKVNPLCLAARAPLFSIDLLRIRHHLDQLDDAPLGILRVEDTDFDAAEEGVRCGEYVFFAHQTQLALHAIEAALTQCRPFMGQTDLRQLVFGRPGRHHRSAQVTAVLRQTADRTQTGAQCRTDNHQRHQHFEQSEACATANIEHSIIRIRDNHSVRADASTSLSCRKAQHRSHPFVVRYRTITDVSKLKATLKLIPFDNLRTGFDMHCLPCAEAPEVSKGETSGRTV